MSIRMRLAAIPLGMAAVALLGAGASVHVPYATSVNVHVRSEVSSAHAQIGDPVAIEVVQDVIVDGYVVISRGADGLAKVAAVTTASASSPGQVMLDFKWVHAVDGSKIGVVGRQAAAGVTSNASSDPTASLSGVQKAAQDSGVNANGVNQAAGWLGRASRVMGDLGVSAHAKATEGALEPDRTIGLTVRNPNGVSIVSTTRAAADSDESDVK